MNKYKLAGLLSLIAYLIASFVAVDMNPFSWHGVGRLVLCFAICLVWFICLLSESDK